MPRVNIYIYIYNKKENKKMMKTNCKEKLA